MHETPTPDHRPDQWPDLESGPAFEPEPVTVAVDIDADPVDVWRALTTDEGLAPWLGEGASVEAMPGGTIVAPDVVTGLPRRGVIDHIDPARRLAFTWWPEGDPETRTAVEVVIDPTPERTRLTVTETLPVATLHSRQLGVASGAASVDWAWRCSMLALAAQPAACPTLCRS